MITKPTFVGPDFTRRPVKYERFIRPMGLRYKKANVTVSHQPTSYQSFSVLTTNSAPGTWCHRSATYHQRQEEPAKPNVHSAGCFDEGYGYRGEC
jgi:hypothetical protein